MKEKRSLNRNHPDFPEYQKKFFEIVEEMNKEIDRQETQIPQFGGLDGTVVEIRKKYHLLISQLQEYYSYLFVKAE